MQNIQQLLNLLNWQKRFSHKSEIIKLTMINICLMIAYSIGVQISIKITTFNGSSAIWLPSGMTLAAVIFFGIKVFPGIFFVLLLDCWIPIYLLIPGSIYS